MLLFGRLFSRSYSVLSQTIRPSALKQQLVDRISNFGPITVAEYMKECLTNPSAGYYINSNVFGRSGDFITSPDVSQIFGELVGSWFVQEWMRQQLKAVQLVELGPGRGTLFGDIIRVLSKFPDIYNATSLHLVEISPKMRKMQEETLTRTSALIGCQPVQTTWYNDLLEVPEELPSFFLAHEFLDALPVHCFQKSGDEWHEVLVDADTKSSDDQEAGLRFVRSKAATPAQIAYLPINTVRPRMTSPQQSLKKLVQDLTQRTYIEVSPKSLEIIDKMCQRIARTGAGASLVVDYGHEGEKGSTLRGFRKHQLCDPLEEPGLTDLTCDVDFSLLRHIASKFGDQVESYGPVTQAYFLINMGLFSRLKTLLSKCPSDKQKEELFSGCEMLITSEQMGERFKFLALLPHRKSEEVELALPGFSPLPGTPYSS